VVVAPNKIESLADTIQLITKNKDRQLEIAKNCENYSQDYLSINQILKNNFLH
jgi:hypothetical protein